MKSYFTNNISSTQANSTVTIRPKSTGCDGELGFFTVLKDSAHTVAFYDGDPAAGGTLIGTKPASIAAGTYWLLRPCKNGIFATVAASYAGELVVGFI